MKKVLLVFMVLLAFAQCKKNTKTEPDTPKEKLTISIENGEAGKLTLQEDKAEVIVLKGATLAEVNIKSSDTTVVAISDSLIVAVKPGNATVTATLKSDTSVAAKLEVAVVTFLEGVQFVDMVYLPAKYDWQDKEATIITVREYSANMGDDNLKKSIDHAGDTADIDSWIDEVTPGNWYYLYTKENGDEIGVFADTISIRRAVLISQGITFDNNNKPVVADRGVVLEFTDVYYHNAKGNFISGMRTVVDDVKNVKRQFVKFSGSAQPFPGYIQKSHLNTNNYLAYFTDILGGGSASQDDFPFYDNYDSYFYQYRHIVSEYDDFITSMNYGHLVSGQFNVVVGTPMIDYVNLDAEIMENSLYDYGLKTTVDPKSGGEVLVQPFEMAATTKHTFKTGTAPSNVRAQKPISNAQLERIMSFKRAMYATLIMASGL